MNLTHRDPFNFTVGNIGFVMSRAPDIRWKMDRMTQKEQYILVLACSGKANYETDVGTFPVKKGDVMLFRKGESRAASSDPEDPWSFIAVAFDLIPLEHEAPVDIDVIPMITAPRFSSEYVPLFSELTTRWNLRDNGSLLKCRSLICEVLYMLIRETQNAAPSLSHSDSIVRVKSFLAEHYTESYHIDELAAMTELSPSHFRMLFKQQTGETVLRFHNRLKIAKACDLLRSGTCNVTEAAYATGFSDVYYFSRLFKKITGRSPSRYLSKSSNKKSTL